MPATKALAPAEETVPASVPDKVINDVVAEIHQIARAAPLQMALTIGKLIVERLYGGDLSAWRQRGVKDASFRKLMEHEGLPDGVNATGLYRSVALHEMFTELEADVSTWKHLGISHVRAVLVLPEPKQQKKLLDQADQKRWTVERLESEVNKKHQKASRGGRPPLPQFVKSIHRLEKFVENRDLLLADLDSVRNLSAETIAELREVVGSMQQQLAELAEALQGPES